MSAAHMGMERARYDDVSVRWAEPRDHDAIRRVAERDSKTAPVGPALVAEVGGRVLAVRPLGEEEPVADPFRPTRDLVALLELRAAQLSLQGRPKGRGVGALWLSRRFGAGSRSGTSAAAPRPSLVGR